VWSLDTFHLQSHVLVVTNKLVRQLVVMRMIGFLELSHMISRSVNAKFEEVMYYH